MKNLTTTNIVAKIVALMGLIAVLTPTVSTLFGSASPIVQAVGALASAIASYLHTSPISVTATSVVAAGAVGSPAALAEAPTIPAMRAGTQP